VTFQCISFVLVESLISREHVVEEHAHLVAVYHHSFIIYSIRLLALFLSKL